MRLHSALIYGFLFASVVLADDHQFVEADIELITRKNGTFSSAVANITAPQVSGSVNDSVTAYVSLDLTQDCPTGSSIGLTCFVVQAPSKTSCKAWHWIQSDDNYHSYHVIPGIQIPPGDTLTFGVTTPSHHAPDPSDNHGVVVYLEGSKPHQTFKKDVWVYKPCGLQAGWTVSSSLDVSHPDLRYYHPLAHFGTVEFKNAAVYAHGVKHSPLDSMAQVQNLTNSDGTLVAFVSRLGYAINVTDVRVRNGN